MLERAVAERLENLRRLVIDDRQLIDRLLPLTAERFVAEVVEIARSAGIELTADDVVAGCKAARRRRLERWL